MQTRSAYLKSPWQCTVKEVELPDSPPDGYVLVRVEACGICGTDLGNAVDKMDDWQPFGHEVAGVIAKLGANCGKLQLGEKVVLESSGFCGTCDVCRNGRVDLCNKAPQFWNAGPSMGFSDYLLAPACCIVPYEGLTPEVASLAEPAGVAADMVKTADIQLGDRVCLVGPGPIGLMAIPLALRSGAEKVVCIGRPGSSQRLSVAKQLGAEVIATDAGIVELTELHGQFDKVLMTAPVQYLADALPLLAYGGIMSYIGIGSGNGRVQFDGNDFHFRKLQLRASFASPALYYPLVLKLLKNGTIPGELIISHRMKLADIDEAMKLCRDDKASTVKVIIQP